MTELNLFLQAVRSLEALEKHHRGMVGAWVKYLEEALKGSSIDWPKVNRILDSMSQYSKSRGLGPDNKTPSDGSPRPDENLERPESGRTQGGPLTTLRYLTEEGKQLLRAQIEAAQKDISIAGLEAPGSAAWRLAKRYKDGLEFLLDMEPHEI